MDSKHDDECRYCEQDRHGGWIYCRSCGRLLSRTDVITVKATSAAGTATARSGSTNR
jgi:hypothetical protein